MAASMPTRGTREYEWWLAGAEAEAAARKEGRSKAGLAVRDLVDAFAENYPDMTEADIAREVHYIIVGTAPDAATSRNGTAMTLYDYLASLWRTVVPLIVGVLGTWLAHAGIGIDSTLLASWLGGAFASVYYALFRLLEAHVSARWGWLLGLARPPKYPDSGGVRPLPPAGV